jgi:Chaperone of endosialidase
MKPIVKTQTAIPGFLIGIAIAGSTVFPIAQAVSPPPDGGYPGFNTAEGAKALQNLSSGVANTGLGWYALLSDAAGNYNTAVGAGALIFNAADSNTAVGAAALLLNSTGTQNVAVGSNALGNNNGGFDNNAVGYFTLFNNTSGNSNNAVGTGALSTNHNGAQNSAFGDEVLISNISGNGNAAVGSDALFSNVTGDDNTAIGLSALNNSTGSSNTALGAFSASGVTTANGVICIAALGANVDNSCFIGHIRDVATQNADAIPVVIDTNNQLGTMSSSRRFKKEIKPMGTASEAILSLKPASFYYKSDSKGTPQFGLIAEEVAEVNPALVVRDKNGEIYTVRYDAVNAMLLNEFLKEHRKVEEQQTTITQLKAELRATAARQQKQIEMLTAGLEKVRAQMETKTPTTKVALTEP